MDATSPQHLSSLLERFVRAEDVEQLAEVVVTEIQTLTGYDRVLLYRFEREGDCQVLAEVGRGAPPSFLGMRFPGMNIPAQARRLYVEQRIRQIPDVDYQPVPIIPALSPVDGEPLDLSPCHLRSVSPFHRAFMRSMGTTATMSISLVIDGRLWG